jgi:two-component system, NtrC family, response regulator AtoC
MREAFLGNDPAIRKIRELITMVSDTGFNVLITGETGTGKELVAKLLHLSSPRRNHRFVKIHCAALPLTLLESELFGYEKGAFSGAVRSKPGRFELAAKGVVFLDEIADMNLALQAKFLQVLQNGEFTRLGGTQDIRVDSWVIAATHHDLEQDIRYGRFREDLYYRINIIRIHIPPLRDRKGDLPLLIDHFVERYQQDFRLDRPLDPLRELMPGLTAYHWPGNVRELGSVILRILLGEDPEGIHAELAESMRLDGLFVPKTMFPSAVCPEPETGRAPGALRPLKEVQREAADGIERRAILQALGLNRGNKRHAARMLGISYKTLFSKMARLGIPYSATERWKAPAQDKTRPREEVS